MEFTALFLAVTVVMVVAWFACQGHVVAHYPCELAADRKAQPRPAACRASSRCASVKACGSTNCGGSRGFRTA